MATDKLVDFDHVTDYISREAAWNGIYSCPTKTDADGYIWVRTKDVAHMIDEIPAADVRPVVLCRDCKHFNPYPGDCTDGGIEGVCKRHNSIGVLVMDEDFCSDAERI